MTRGWLLFALAPLLACGTAQAQDAQLTLPGGTGQTAVFDASNNLIVVTRSVPAGYMQLYRAYDGSYRDPVVIVEGFDPLNEALPADVYAQVNPRGGIDMARAAGRSVWIVNLGDGHLNTNPLPKMVIGLDDVPPTGAVSINGGAAYTTSTSVTLALAASDDGGIVAEMRISDDGVFDAEPWEPYSTSKAWTLADGDGSKTVYARFSDPSGNESATASASILLDTAAPILSSVTVSPMLVAAGDAVRVTVLATPGEIVKTARPSRTREAATGGAISPPKRAWESIRYP